MTDIPSMKETDHPLEDARKYLIDYTEYLRTNGNNRMQERNMATIDWRDFEVLSLTIQDLLEHVQRLQNKISELEKN